MCACSLAHQINSCLSVSSRPLNRLAERITDAVAAMPEFKSSKSVSCFLSMDGEVDTSIIVKSILAQGWTITSCQFDR